MEALTLAKAALARTLLAASYGEAIAPRVRQLLVYGRRPARCDDGGLLIFVVGQHIEGLGCTLARWAAHWGLLRPDERQALGAELASDALAPADLGRALDVELAGMLRGLPAAGQDDDSYSRAGTERLFRAKLAEVEGALGPADFVALRRELDGLVDDQERGLIKSAGKGGEGPDWPRLAQLGSRNLAGRWLATVLLPPMLGTLERSVEALQDSAGKRLPEAIGDGGVGGEWIEAGSDELEEAATPTEPSTEPGRCTRLAPLRYRLDRGTQKRLADGADLLARSARIIPHFQDGGVDGMLVLGLVRDSWVVSCGFENHDVILLLNGRDFRDPAAGLEAMDAVRAAGHATFVLLRRGQRIAVTVEGNP
jgi:hypothetical protein